MLREADQAVADGAPKFVSVQNHYNLLHRDDEHDAIPECEKLGISYLPYFPLASGLLSGKYTRGEAPPEGTRLQRWGERAQGSLTDENFDVVDALSDWAKDHGHSVLELAIAWLAAKPFVGSVIAGATKPEQVSANAAAGRVDPVAGRGGRGRIGGRQGGRLAAASGRPLGRLPAASVDHFVVGATVRVAGSGSGRGRRGTRAPACRRRSARPGSRGSAGRRPGRRSPSARCRSRGPPPPAPSPSSPDRGRTGPSGGSAPLRALCSVRTIAAAAPGR